MSICEIGEKKKIGGKWYRKAATSDIMEPCKGCAFSGGSTHANFCLLKNERKSTVNSIEDSGRECGTLLDNPSIWVACLAPKPAKKPAPAKWTTIPADTKLTKAKVIEMANKLGAENAKLKNKIAKGVG